MAHAVFNAESVHFFGLRPGVKPAIVNVRDARIFALGLADRPAHDLDATKAFVARASVSTCLSESSGDDGGDESEFHGFGSGVWWS